MSLWERIVAWINRFKQKPTPGPVPTPTPPPTDNVFVDVINKWVVQHHGSSFKANAAATQQSYNHALATAQGRQQPHEGFAERTRIANMRTENWCMDSSGMSPEIAVDMWAGSPGHRDNMLSGDAQCGAATAMNRTAVMMTGSGVARSLTQRFRDSVMGRKARVVVTVAEDKQSSSARLVWD